MAFHYQTPDEAAATTAARTAREAAHRAAYPPSFAKMSTYARGVYNLEHSKDLMMGGVGKVATPVAAGAAVYGLGGWEGVAAVGGVYAAHKGLTFHRHKVAEKHANRVYNRLVGSRGADVATKYAHAAYRRTASQHFYNWRTWSAIGGRAAMGAAGKGLFAAARALPGLAGGAALAAGSLAASLVRGAKAFEYGARAVLTGGLPKRLGGLGVADDVLDAYMPFRHLPKGDVRRFALNPRIANRLAWGATALAVGGLLKDMTLGFQTAPPPTAYFDGRTIHHMNDMGANADYAQTVLGSNSAYYRGLAPVAEDAFALLGRAALTR